MKNYWTVSIPLVLIAVLFILFHMKTNPQEMQIYKNRECLFNHETAVLLGRLYTLSSPVKNPEELAGFIQQHRDFFFDEGLLIRATRALGNWLIYQDIGSINGETINRISHELQKCDLSPDSAYKLLLKFKKSDTNPVILGKELIWLAGVLPDIARGNMKLYLHSGTRLRREMRRVIPLYRSLSQTDPQIANGILDNMNRYDRVTGEEISLLAILSEI